MADAIDTDAAPRQTADKPKEVIPLSKKERRDLLAEIERVSSGGEPPERLLQRAQQALTEGSLERAQRLVAQLEEKVPRAAGLALFKAKLEEAQQRSKQAKNLRTTEEMLVRYIQQRKKALAQLALETLVEIAPDHPRRQDFQTWIADLDQEVALQARIDGELAAGRAALRAENLNTAHKHLEVLRKLAPGAAETLAAEITRLTRGQEEGADIQRRKERFESLLEAEEVNGAEAELEALAALDVPKVTLDFLHQRVEALRAQLRARAELETLESVFRQHLEAANWQAARDVVHAVGQLFRDGRRAAAMFEEANRLEAEQRRGQSIRQGVDTVEALIAQGNRQEAEVALQVLRRLDLERELLASLEQRIAQL